MWARPFKMDVSNGTIYEIVEGICEKQGPTRGGMAEGYALEESLGFCTEYIQEFESTRRRVWDDKEDARVADEVPEGNGKPRKMSSRFRAWAHNYILNNTTCMEDWHR